MKPIRDTDRVWVKETIKNSWGSEKIVTKGKIHNAGKADGYIAWMDGKPIGLLTYEKHTNAYEILTLDALTPNQGIGTALIQQLSDYVHKENGKRIFVIATNDNLDALRFYQRRGFRMKAVYPNAIERSRILKPEIPAVGRYKIPIRDEIELELR